MGVGRVIGRGGGIVEVEQEEEKQEKQGKLFCGFVGTRPRALSDVGVCACGGWCVCVCGGWCACVWWLV